MPSGANHCLICADSKFEVEKEDGQDYGYCGRAKATSGTTTTKGAAGEDCSRNVPDSGCAKGFRCGKFDFGDNK